MKKFLAFLKSLLPIKFADEVPAAVRAQIDFIERKAKDDIEALRAAHSVKAIEADADEDIADADRLAALFRQLLAERRDAKVKEASAILPPLDLGPAVTDPVK